MVIDLNCASIDPLRLIAGLKALPEMKGITVLGFVSHVQDELKQKAQKQAATWCWRVGVFSKHAADFQAIRSYGQVGRTPWSAADALVGLRFRPKSGPGVRRGRGRPPYRWLTVNSMYFLGGCVLIVISCCSVQIAFLVDPHHRTGPILSESETPCKAFINQLDIGLQKTAVVEGAHMIGPLSSS